MAEVTGIAWTTSTFNSWIGCTKVGRGCDFCYAEVWDARYSPNLSHWGPGAPRRRTTVQNWNQPRRWQRDRRAALDRGENPPPHRVFCASLADVFDNEVPPEWRDDLWALIEDCPDLEWQIVTKRVGNVRKMVPFVGLPTNVILIATIVDQDEANRDLQKLRYLKMDGYVRRIGVSYEPALGPVDWSKWLRPEAPGPYAAREVLDWIIVGGESTQGGATARAFDVEWARSTIRQCHEAGVAVFMKQMGSTVIARDWPAMPFPRDRAGANPAEWPEDLRVRDFPNLGVR